MRTKHIMEVNNVKHTFSFVSADEMVEGSPVIVDLEKENQDLRKRLEACGTIMIPFMKALCQEPDKDYIKWPGRVKILKDQIQKVSELTSVPDTLEYMEDDEEESLE